MWKMIQGSTCQLIYLARLQVQKGSPYFFSLISELKKSQAQDFPRNIQESYSDLLTEGSPEWPPLKLSNLLQKQRQHYQTTC